MPVSILNSWASGNQVNEDDMADRKKTPQEIETEVLVRSRRRCCICHGLRGDFHEKKGQLAHLDQNRDNSSFENLAYLCLEHHDEYDSTTSQSKGFTFAEAKRYREALYTAVARSFDSLEPAEVGVYEHTESSSQFIEVAPNKFAVIFSRPMRCTPTLKFQGLPAGAQPILKNWSHLGFTVVFEPSRVKVSTFRFTADARPPD